MKTETPENDVEPHPVPVPVVVTASDAPGLSHEAVNGAEEGAGRGAGALSRAGAKTVTRHRAEHGEARVKLRFWALVLQIAVWVMFLGLVIAVPRHRALERKAASSWQYERIDTGHLAAWLFAIFLPIMYLAYLYFSTQAGTAAFVANVDRELNVQQYVQQLRDAEPKITFNATCFHYESRTRRVGDRTETYQEMVVTYSASKQYLFTTWEDATGELTGTDEVNLTKLHLKKELGFLSETSKDRFFADYEVFCEGNKRDVHQMFSWNMDLSGFKARLLCFRYATVETPCQWKSRHLILKRLPNLVTCHRLRQGSREISSEGVFCRCGNFRRCQCHLSRCRLRFKKICGLFG